MTMVPSQVKSDGTLYFLTKIWFSISLCAMAIICASGFRFWGVVLALPFAIASFFHLFVAEVSAGPDKLLYRRGLRWTNVPYLDVVDCDRSWHPMLGYFRLKHFVSPFGKIYFVRER